MLAKKVHTLYSLAVQQLSKQDHYDFGLRALTSVLRYAGKKKRAHPNMSDEEVFLLFKMLVLLNLEFIRRSPLKLSCRSKVGHRL